MKKALMIASVLLIAVISTACINNMAVQELNNKAAEYMNKGDYEAAMSRLQSSIDLDATMYETHYNLGVAAISAEKYEKAIEALNNGIKLNPNYSEFYYSLAIAESSLADEIIEEAQEENFDERNDKKLELKKEADELKMSSITNLEKYLNLKPDSEDKESIEALIEESKNFIENKNFTKNNVTKVIN